jgi:Domain of unknown function (DUF4259)
MGTWAAGPFGNDAALDFMGDLFDLLMKPVDEFLESPEIDETFDAAFAAIAAMNALMRIAVSRPWRHEAEVDAVAIAEVLHACFNDQIEGMAPAEGFSEQQRAALRIETDAFVALVTGP